MMPPRRTAEGGYSSGPGRPGQRAARAGGGDGRRKPPTIAQLHAEWVGLLRPDGPFIAIPVLTEAFPQFLDTVPDDTLAKVRQAWTEVQEAPDLLTPAWTELILSGLLGYTPAMLAEGGALPEDLRTGSLPGGRLRPDAIAYGPDDQGGRAERLLIYRLPAGTQLTTASKVEPSLAEQAASLCRHRDTPLALLTNGAQWVLVHAKPGEPATTAAFDADLWLEERDLLRAFASLLAARRVLPPPKNADGSNSWSLAALFTRSAEAQAEVTTTLGTQVRQAVELLVGELSRLDRESGGILLGDVPPRQVYRGALTVMMRLVFLLYAEEQRLLPVSSDLYATAYSVGGLHAQLEADQNLYGEEVGDRRAAAWPRLLATFAAVYEGCEYDEMRIPPYGGSLFDPARYPWLDHLAVTDRVVHEMLGALLILKRGRSGAERLSYKGLDVAQIGHVYEGLLEFSCLRVDEPYLGLIGKLEPELPLTEVEQHAEQDGFFDWLAKTCDASPAAISKAMGSASEDLAALHAASDNDADLAERIRPVRGLLRKDLRGLPTVFPARSLIITQVGDRRATGTHYTPRKLAEEIVKYTLEPLCYSPGPADGVDPDPTNVRPDAELLDLKVLDPAMGSGAFLVSACRFLGERLIEAWERDGYPDEVQAALGPDFNRDDADLEARRRVAARCLYGVDRDEAAVELGKLSLWLVTLAKDQPFSFLDHALRCGDSLVGLTSESQIQAFHLDPETGRRINARLSGVIDEVVGPILNRIGELREEIEAEPVRDLRQARELAAKLSETDQLVGRLRDIADAVSAAALSTAGQSADALDARLTGLSEQAQRIVQGEIESPLEQAFRAKLDAWLRGPRLEPIRPLHWALEFPEVMSCDGFNAIVSNPPFIGGKKISGALGTDYREYLKQTIARDKPGHADLCSYFLLRDLMIAPHGRTGIIATNTIAQGDTREVGLDQVADIGWTIYRADKSKPWPGTASLEVSLIWTGHPGYEEKRILGGRQVSGITPSLDSPPRMPGNPYRLAANAAESFIGCYVLGTGFVLTVKEAHDLIVNNPRNKDVVFPYLNGDDLNSNWDCLASRWVIDFNDWPVEKAMEYPDAFKIIEERVRPERQRRKLSGEYVLRNPLPHRWWQYADKRPALRKAIATLDRILVLARHSKVGLPQFVTTTQIISDAVAAFASDSAADLSLLSSSIHFNWWTTKGESTLENRLRYTPSDGFETFPRPTATKQQELIGEELNEFRSDFMARHKMGLTEVYNLVYNKTVSDEEIVLLRAIHVQIDEAVLEAYAQDEEREPEIREYEMRVTSAPLPSWREVDFAHGFYPTEHGTIRFTISPHARLDVLDKLLALNHYRYEQEARQGLHSKKGLGAARRKRNATVASASAAPMLDDGGLFRPEGTLF
jgi:hypothetical protein